MHTQHDCPSQINFSIYSLATIVAYQKMEKKIKK